jgi:hypothetical protein
MTEFIVGGWFEIKLCACVCLCVCVGGVVLFDEKKNRGRRRNERGRERGGLLFRS